MKRIILSLFLSLSFCAISQETQQLSPEDLKSLDFERTSRLVLGVETKKMLDHPGDVLVDFNISDIPAGGIDSMILHVGDAKYKFPYITPILIKNVQGEVEIDASMYKNGNAIKFKGSNKDKLKAKLKVHPEPLISEDSVVFGLLAVVLALIFFSSHSEIKIFKRFYAIIPALLLCYLIPGLLNTFGIISSEYSGLYGAAKTYFLPAALILMTIGIDFKGIINLGPKALIMFFTATIGIILGGPIAIWIYSYINPEVVGGVGNEATWRGMSTLAGSWIGGGANQMAMLELYEYKKGLFGKMIVVDVIVAQMWMMFLLWGAARHHIFDRWLKADNSAIEDLQNRMESYEAQTSRKPSLRDYIVILGFTFGLVAIAHVLSSFLGPYFNEKFGETSPLSSSFFWLVVLCTVGALIYSATKVRTFEGAGASKIGSVFIYLLVAIIGMKMDINEALEEPQLILVGIIWMAFHAGLLFLVAKWIRAPFFFLAVGSKANVGGAASAPVVAAAFHPSLASVGVLLAVLGYGIGSVGAILCAELMAWVAP